MQKLLLKKGAASSFSHILVLWRVGEMFRKKTADGCSVELPDCFLFCNNFTSPNHLLSAVPLTITLKTLGERASAVM